MYKLNAEILLNWFMFIYGFIAFFFVLWVVFISSFLPNCISTGKL